MIWIASFPRSGNTFVRNLFFDVFGLESAAYPAEGKPKDNTDFSLCKTHHLPSKIKTLKPNDFVIYLVRDGRDAIVSNSYYRKNFTDPLADINAISKEQILAQDGSHFGGWSHNVFAWSKRAQMIIRFEDIVKEPEYWLTLIAKKTNLPSPNYRAIKSFEQLKEGHSRYGSGAKHGDTEAFAKKFFRKGKIGAFKQELPKSLQRLFWLHHGDVMLQLGYTKAGEVKDFVPQRIKRGGMLTKNYKKWLWALTSKLNVKKL